MSRSGYSDDWDGDIDTSGLYRHALNRALGGKRGQAFLREALAALDAMPVKELAADSLVNANGGFCTLGAVGAARGIDMSKIDPENPVQVGQVFGIAESMAREIVYENDENGHRWEDLHWVRRNAFNDWPASVRVEETPAERWQRMRKWVVDQLIPAAA